MLEERIRQLRAATPVHDEDRRAIARSIKRYLRQIDQLDKQT
jgi:hypothetical protein